MHPQEISIRNRPERGHYRQCLLCQEPVVNEGKHVWCCKTDKETSQTRSNRLHADIKRNAQDNLRRSSAHSVSMEEPQLNRRGVLTKAGMDMRLQGDWSISRADTGVVIRGHNKNSFCIDYTAADSYKKGNVTLRRQIYKPLTPHTVAEEGEQGKLKRYEKVWENAKELVDIMGFSTLGAWGPSAEETVNELFEDGPMWTSRTRRIAEKHNFICGISSTIKFTVARAWIKWLRGEGNHANTLPPNANHLQGAPETAESERYESDAERDAAIRNRNEREDENERVDNVNNDMSDYTESDNENNVEIDGETFANNTENSDEGSDTQSIIMDNSDNMDSLGVENGSSSPMLNL